MRRGTAGILGIYWAIPTTPAISRRAACRRWLVSVCDGNVWQVLSGEWCFSEAPFVCNNRPWLITLKVLCAKGRVNATNSEEDTTPAEDTKPAMKASRNSQCTTQQSRKSSSIHQAMIGCCLVVSSFCFPLHAKWDNYHISGMWLNNKSDSHMRIAAKHHDWSEEIQHSGICRRVFKEIPYHQWITDPITWVAQTMFCCSWTAPLRPRPCCVLLRILSNAEDVLLRPSRQVLSFSPMTRNFSLQLGSIALVASPFLQGDLP